MVCLQLLEKKVKEAIANNSDVKGAIENYNNAAKNYEERFNTDTRPGAKKIILPKITDKSPGISVKNKDAYKKYGRFFNNHYENFGYSFEIPKNLKPLPQIEKELSDPKNLAKAEKAMKLGDARIFSNPFFDPSLMSRVIGDMASSLGSPTAIVGLNVGLGVDPRESLDRAVLGAEAALAPSGIKALTSRLANIKNPLVRKGIETAAGLRLPGVFTPANVIKSCTICITSRYCNTSWRRTLPTR